MVTAHAPTVSVTALVSDADNGQMHDAHSPNFSLTALVPCC